MESRIHFGGTSEYTTRDPGSTIRDPESTGWDLEYEGHLDFFTYGELD